MNGDILERALDGANIKVNVDMDKMTIALLAGGIFLAVSIGVFLGIRAAR